MTTNEARERFLFFTAKNNTGYISPEEFDRVMNMAQYAEYGFYLGFPEQYRPDNVPPAVAYDKTRRIADALLPFKVNTGILLTNGIGTFPSDYVYLDALRSRYYINPKDCDGDNGEPSGVHTYVPIDIITEKEFGDRTISKIDWPTTRWPVCRFRTATTIEVLPTTIRRVEFVYLRQPKPFHWAYTVTNGEPVWDQTSQNDQPLEWYEIDQNKIIIRALSYFGIAIREQQLIQYAEGKTQAGV
jgi:hypothetical protein